MDPDDKRIFWLNGMAGTGKTTIAYSLCEILGRLGLLGATFFCSRNAADCSAAENIPSTIAFQLSLHSAPFSEKLAASLESNGGHPGQNIKELFKHTLLNPLEKMHNQMQGIPIIVIDALDECADVGIVQELVSELWEHSASLPVKIFVTSRPEPQFHGRIYGRDDKLSLRFHLHEVGASFVRADIELFVKEQLGNLRGEDPRWSSLLDRLVDWAGNLFICAATASMFIQEGLDGFRADRLQSIISHSSADMDALERLYELYRAVLQVTLEQFKLPRETQMLLKTLDTIVHLQEPLCLQDLATITCIPKGTVQHLLLRLHSVLSVPEGSSPVQPLHASFPDYLATSKHLPEAFHHTPRSPVHMDLSESSFRIMNDKLKFNISNFPSSYQANSEIPRSHFHASIGSLLSYACRFWSHHLKLASNDHEALRLSHGLVERFTKDKILFWLEVLSVLEVFGSARASLVLLTGLHHSKLGISVCVPSPH